MTTAVLGIGATLLMNLAGWLVAWGALKTTVKALGERVSALESDAGAVAELRIHIAKIETRLDGLLEQFRELNSAIRWMRSDVNWEPPAAPAAASRRRGRA